MWSIETELCAITRSSTVNDALATAGLNDLCPVTRITVTKDWWQAGAESFCCVFEVEGPRRRERYILKSFVPSPGTRTVSESIVVTQRRSSDLATAGIRSPTCFGVANGTAWYEYIPYSIQEGLAKADAEGRLELGRLARELVRRVFAAGYEPRDLIRDLRTDGIDVYMIDFGWDLGEPSPGHRSTGALTLALESIDRLVQRAESTS